VYYDIFKPWLDESDASHVFFGSVHLVDVPSYFYPCSGLEGDNDFDAYPNIVNVQLSPIPNSKQGHWAPGK
jgi:hypothetical protein